MHSSLGSSQAVDGGDGNRSKAVVHEPDLERKIPGSDCGNLSDSMVNVDLNNVDFGADFMGDDVDMANGYQLPFNAPHAAFSNSNALRHVHDKRR